jgi:hypothetical protein
MISVWGRKETGRTRKEFDIFLRIYQSCFDWFVIKVRTVLSKLSVQVRFVERSII